MKYYIWTSDPHGSGQPWIDLVQKAQHDYPNAETIFGGDYIDSNKYSNEVVNFVMDQVKHNHASALIGNHEQLMYEAVEHAQNGPWYMNGAKHTIRSFFKRGFSKQHTRSILRSDPRYLFLITLPTVIVRGSLIFVHAGLSRSELLDTHFIAESIPTIKDDPNYITHLWTRSKYLYQDDHVTFNHNYTPYTIISGHTPTMLINGVYEPDIDLDPILPTYNFQFYPEDPKLLERPCPVRKVQYPGEPARFFTDDGCHGANQHHGNVCVFNDSGQLVKVYNSDPKEDPYYDPIDNPVSIKEPIDQ